MSGKATASPLKHGYPYISVRNSGINLGGELRRRISVGRGLVSELGESFATL